MKRHLLPLALLTLTFAPNEAAFANGGGYLTGGVTSSGNVLGFEPKATENIRILDEQLTAKLGPNSARVEVRYRMKNETDAEVTVRFGFPVEETGRGEDFDGDGDGVVVAADIEGIDPEFLPKPHRELGYCQNYRVEAGGKALKATWEEEKRGKKDPLFRHLAGWLISEMTFAGGEEKEVSISFDSVYPKAVRWVSDDSHTGASLFKYRLSTAACWAGTIAKGRVVLEPAGIAPEELRVIKPVNRFRKEGQNWVWEFTDLEPTLADDFEVEAQPEVTTFTRYDEEKSTTYANRGERWTMVHANYEIRASSTLAPQGDFVYEAENLKGWDAWAEGAIGPGTGEWLDLKPVTPKPLVAISFDPGLDGNDGERYVNNARPKKVRLELNGEHSVTLDVPDSPEEFRTVIAGYDKPVETIRLTFEEIWPGKKDEDLCLRNLRLHVALDKKPEVQRRGEQAKFPTTAMKAHAIVLLSCVAAFAPNRVLSNGGGYVTGGSEFTGDAMGFEPNSTGSVRMVEEDLRIKLGAKSAKVELRYRMGNVTKRRVTVRFGFPVEESPSVHGLGIGAFLPTTREIETHSSPLYCKDYRILDGQKALKTKWQSENRAAEDERFTNLVGWYVSEVSFAPEEVKEWTLAFESVYPLKIHSVSDDGFVSAAVFKYRLSTAACWAGTIAEGRIVLEPEGIDPWEVRVIKPVNRFRKEGNNWVWEFADLEPTFDDDLEIEASPSVSTYSRGGDDGAVTYFNRGDRWEISHSNYSIQASSTLPPDGDLRYGPENLKEWDTPWSEGAAGPGVGEWLELVPVSEKPLAAISFTPGYSRSGAGFYKANARPKLVRIELNGEHSFTASVEDRSESIRIPITGYDEPVSRIRMTFEEVWPGERFEDLCLRTLRLHARLNQDPKIQPAR